MATYCVMVQANCIGGLRSSLVTEFDSHMHAHLASWYVCANINHESEDHKPLEPHVYILN